MNTLGKESALETIRAICAKLSAVRTTIKEGLAALQMELLQVQRRHYRTLKQNVDDASDLAANLQAMIEAHPELFKQPKTFSVSGIKIGYSAMPGKFEWDDDEKLVKAIRKHFGEEADRYLIIKEKPSADALKSVDAKILAKLGVHVVGAGDKVVIKLQDSETDKLFAKLLEEAASEEDKAA